MRRRHDLDSGIVGRWSGRREAKSEREAFSERLLAKDF
jgi:hypothetical protein